MIAPDVVIIGSGAGGGTMAFALSRKKVNVLVLEAGGRYDPTTDYKLATEGWESGFPHRPNTENRYTFGELQALDPAHADLCSWNAVAGRTNPSDRRKPHKYHHVRGVGGSTLAFTGESHRLHPDAMEMRTRFGVGADWPIDYAELEPYYSEAERLVGVAGPTDPGARWRSEPYPLPPHPLSYASEKLAAGSATIDLNWGPNARAALSQPYDGRPHCNYCANCNRGCPRTDKGSIDVTFLRKAEASGHCTIRTGITVLQIEAGPDDQVRGVHFIDADGTESFLKTPRLVIACGAIETPRLLLTSDIGNESGQVGKNFMETLSFSTSGLHPDPLGSHRGLPADSICWDYNAPDAIPDVPGGVRFNAGVHEAGLNGPLAYAQRVVGGWGRDHHQQMRDAFGHALTVGAIGESLPSEKSYIDLDPTETDANGTSLARIHSHLDATEIARLRFMADKSREILTASGVTERVEEYGTYDFFSSTHVFGTCRMGTDPETSVVDDRGRSHRWKNLQILDASVLPSTGGGESPSLTIEALALRAAAET